MFWYQKENSHKKALLCQKNTLRMRKAQGSDLCFFPFKIKLLSYVKQVHLQRAGPTTTGEKSSCVSALLLDA